MSVAVPLDIVVTASDNSTNLQSQLVMSGALSQTQTVALALSPGVTTTNIFSVSLAGVTQNGASLTATVRATDDAGNATTVVRNFTVPGAVTIGGTMTVGSAAYTITINGMFTLESGSVLNNPGTVMVGAFVNTGGTINGNPPVAFSPPAPLVINSFSLSSGGNIPGPSTLIAGQMEVVLTCDSLPRRKFAVEGSTDLKHWSEIPATIQETVPGRFRAVLTVNSPGARFFRLRSSP